MEKKRLNVDLTKGEAKQLEDLCSASGDTQKIVIREALYFLSNHIKRTSEGFNRTYVKGEEVRIIEHRYDDIKL